MLQEAGVHGQSTRPFHLCSHEASSISSNVRMKKTEAPPPTYMIAVHSISSILGRQATSCLLAVGKSAMSLSAGKSARGRKLQHLIVPATEGRDIWSPAYNFISKSGLWGSTKSTNAHTLFQCLPQPHAEQRMVCLARSRRVQAGQFTHIRPLSSRLLACVLNTV